MGKIDTLKIKILMFLGLVIAIVAMVMNRRVQNNGGRIVVKPLTIETDEGWKMGADLYRPGTVGESNPAPGIVLSHGSYGNKEMMDIYAIELARRGYVVLSIDQPNHGDSENYADDSNDAVFRGVNQAVLYISRLSYIEKTKIGVLGFAEGGDSCNYAIQIDNLREHPLISSVLLNCSDAIYKVDGEYKDVYLGRHAGIISARYDELYNYYWGEEEGRTSPATFSPQFLNNDDHIYDNPNPQSFLNYGADPVNSPMRDSDTIYRFNNRPTDPIRVVYRPNMTHHWAMFSKRATAQAINFFENAFATESDISPFDQIWQRKEIISLIGLFGIGLFIAALAVSLTRTVLFCDLCLSDENYIVDPYFVRNRKGKVWFWGLMGVCTAFTAVVYERVVGWGASLVNYMRQPQSFGLSCWLFISGLFMILAMFVYYREYGRKNKFNIIERGVLIHRTLILKTAILGVIVGLAGYFLVFVARYGFHTEFRFWTLAFRTFSADKIWVAFFPHLLMNSFFFVALSLLQNCFSYTTVCGKLNSLVNAVFAVIPAALLPLLQYLRYKSTGRMLFWSITTNYQLYTTWLFPFVLLFFGLTFLSRFVYKRTGNAYIAGVANAVIVTLTIISNTRMFF